MSNMNTLFVLSCALVIISNSIAMSIEDLDTRGPRDRKIAFEAHIYQKAGHVPFGTKIIFPAVTLNQGEGYNPHSGKFTAPISGTYKFAVRLCSLPNRLMVFAIMKQESIQLTVTTVYGCGYAETITKLKNGEVVNVVAKWSHSHIWAEIHRVNSFTGYLLFAGQ